MPQSTRQERISKAFEILKYLTADHRTNTYTQVGQQIGLCAQDVSDDSLNPIYWHCTTQGWPPLPVLAVSRRTGIPGVGYLGYPDELRGRNDAEAWAERRKVFERDKNAVVKFDWGQTVAPLEWPTSDPTA